MCMFRSSEIQIKSLLAANSVYRLFFCKVQPEFHMAVWLMTAQKYLIFCPLEFCVVSATLAADN